MKMFQPMRLFERQPDNAAPKILTPQQAAAHNRVRTLRAFWEGLKGSRQFPARADFDMPALQPWLTNIELVEVHRNDDDSIRYKYRLVGTAVNSIDGVEITGKYADEIFSDLYYSVIEPYQEALRTRNPVEYILKPLVNRRGTTYEYCKAVLPLSSDGETIDMLLVYIEEVPGAAAP